LKEADVDQLTASDTAADFLEIPQQWRTGRARLRRSCYSRTPTLGLNAALFTNAKNNSLKGRSHIRCALLLRE